MRKQILGICLFLCLGNTLLGQSEADSLEFKIYISERASELRRTFGTKEFEDYASLNHPKILAAYGGEEQFADMVALTVSAIEQEGAKIDSLFFGNPTRFRKCDTLLTCILPQRMTVHFDKKHIQTTIYLLGVSTDGEKWYFLDTTFGGKEMLEAIVPTLCLSDLPPMEEKVWEDE